jgi:hypothetical protein
MDFAHLSRLCGDFFVNVFLIGFCRHLLLPLVMGLSVLILTGRLAQGYGLHRLIRHERLGKQFVVGVAFGLLLVKTLFVGYLLETARGDGALTLQAWLRCEAPAPWREAGLPVYVVGAVLSFAALLLILGGAVALINRVARRQGLAAARYQDPPPPAMTDADRAAAHVPPAWPLALGVLAAWAGFTLLLVAVGAWPALEGKLTRLGKCVFTKVESPPLGHYTSHDKDYSEKAGLDYALPGVHILAMHGVAVCSTVLAALFYLVLLPNHRLRDHFSPVVPGCFLLNVVVAAVGWMGFFLPGLPPVLAIAALLLLALGGASRYKVRFPNLDYTSLTRLSAYPVPVPPAAPAPPKAPPVPPYPLSSRAIPWAAADRKGVKIQLTDMSFRALKRAGASDASLKALEDLKDRVFATEEEFAPEVEARLNADNPDRERVMKEARKRPLILVCVSGGGIRAAAWTTAVLEQLEKQFAKKGIAFPYQVRLITGASGGMVGAAYYVATLDAPPAAAGPAQVGRTTGVVLDERVRRVSKDSLSPLVYQLIYGDLPKVFWPLPMRRDRGLVLEETWKTNLAGGIDCTFDSLRQGEVEGWRPSLIFSPMMIEDGRRLLFSNLDLAAVTANRGNVLEKTAAVYSRDSLEFFRLFPEATAAFKVSTAVRMNASFPYFSPAGVLPTWPRRRVVDAGYYDNYGVTVAAAWLFKHRWWVLDNASRVVLIQVRDGASQKERKRPEGADGSTVLTRGLEWLLSPPEALLSQREWSMSFRNDQGLQVLTTFFDRKVHDLYFTTVAFEYEGDASLSWYLSCEEKKSIHKEALRVHDSKEMAQLLALWP